MNKKSKTNNPYFSVIIPCLNEEKYLPLLLKDLNTQTFKDFEIIVVDGNSDDKTVSVAKNFPSQQPLHLVSTTTRNVSFQRNLGAKSAIGQVMIFFDADTRIPKIYLKKIYQTFEKKHPHFLTTYIKGDSSKPAEKMYVSLTNFVLEAGKIFKNPISFGAMQAIKKGAFFDVGGYDEKTRFGEDAQIFQNLSKYNYHFFLLTSPCYIYSLRRFRSEGLVKSFVQYLQLNLNIIINGHHSQPATKYEMGGHNFDPDKTKDSQYPKIFDTLISRIKKSSPKENRRLKIIFKRLFS